MKPEHTPRPWKLDKSTGNIYGADDYPVACDVLEKNIAIIEAAPELLEALEIAQNYFNLMESIVNDTCERHRADMLKKRTVKDLTLDDLFELYRVKAKAAIAKVKGSQ